MTLQTAYIRSRAFFKGNGVRGGVRGKQGLRGMVVAVIMVMFANVVFSQDIHFSQTDYIPVLTDPGYSGFFEGKVRIDIPQPMGIGTRPFPNNSRDNRGSGTSEQVSP